MSDLSRVLLTTSGEIETTESSTKSFLKGIEGLLWNTWGDSITMMSRLSE